MEKNMMIIAAIVVVAIGGYYFLAPSYSGDSSTGQEPSDSNTGGIGSIVSDPVTINVVAKRFEFSPNPIVVKEGQTVTLNLTTEDTTHGFSIPAFGINETIPPGQATTVTFVADKPGEYSLSCSVFCGSGHGSMRGTLRVEEA